MLVLHILTGTFFSVAFWFLCLSLLYWYFLFYRLMFYSVFPFPTGTFSYFSLLISLSFPSFFTDSSKTKNIEYQHDIWAGHVKKWHRNSHILATATGLLFFLLFIFFPFLLFRLSSLFSSLSYLFYSSSFSFVFVSSSSFLGSVSGGNRKRRSPVEYRRNLYVRTHIHTSVRPACERPVSASEGLKGGGHTCVHVHTYSCTDFPCILQDFWFPLGPLPKKRTLEIWKGRN